MRSTIGPTGLKLLATLAAGGEIVDYDEAGQLVIEHKGERKVSAGYRANAELIELGMVAGVPPEDGGNGYCFPVTITDTGRALLPWLQKGWRFSFMGKGRAALIEGPGTPSTIVPLVDADEWQLPPGATPWDRAMRDSRLRQLAGARIAAKIAAIADEPES